MDLRKIKKLIELVEESGISELEVTNGEESVVIRRPAVGQIAATPPPVASPGVGAAQSAAGSSVAAAGSSVAAAGARRQPRTFVAPISGTFYVSPAPGAEPFAPAGTNVSAGDVLCIIESMKMMNQIETDLAGDVVAVLVGNGEPVETGTPLFQIL